MPIFKNMKNRIAYYKLSAETTAHEAKLEVQAEEIARPLRDALSKVKSMDELNKLIESDAYKEAMSKYQDLLQQRIEYYEAQMTKLTPLADKISALELGIEDSLRSSLLSDYVENLSNAKNIQLVINYSRLMGMLDK